MHFETPATPQTPALLFPFSALHKWLRCSREFGLHAIRLRNDIALQGNVSPFRDTGPKRIKIKGNYNCNPHTIVKQRHSNKYECRCVDVVFDFAVAIVFDVVFDSHPLGTM
ncbi:hypothetical protein ACO0K9_22670 [Undibacterium sp. Ji50W]|uniref:hypothetical protein n=1 Tax=Undibacterium sp. Ji50W TaxID=3413041 RepID=UPI003BF0E6F1